jgi:hypothetical protein
LAAKADEANEISKEPSVPHKIARESHSRLEKIASDYNRRVSEQTQKLKETANFMPRQPGRRDMRADEIANIADEKINSAMKGKPH